MTRLKLTKNNYYSPEANAEYFSVSQFKAFQKCPACAMAELRGEYQREESRALLLGSLVDEMLTGTKKSQYAFSVEHHDDLYKKNGEPYADVAQAMQAVDRVRAQPLMIHYLTGQKQKIMTGEIEGVPVKIKMDCYKKGEFISDLKYLRDTRSPNLFQNVLSYWGYDIQAAVYQEIVYQNTKQRLPFYFVIVTKEKPVHVAVAEMNQYNIDAAMEVVRHNIKQYAAIKRGEQEAYRCEEHDCVYCAETQILTEPIDSDLLGMSRRQIMTMKGEI